MYEDKIDRISKNIVGKNVEAIRKERKLKQRELVLMLREKDFIISTSGLSKLEANRRKVTDKELVALAEVLEVSIEELLNLK